MKINKKMLNLGMAACLTACSAFAPAKAIAEKLNLGFRTDCFSKYVSRGMTYSENPVIQPSISVNKGSLTAIGITNFDTQCSEFNEYDLVLDYTKTAGNITFSSGYGLYTFPGTEMQKTEEVYASATLEKTFRPTLKAVYDFDKGKGLYAELSAGKDISIGKTTISATGKLGYNNKYFREKSSLSNLEVNLSMPIESGKNMTIRPCINCSKALDLDFIDQFYAGLNLEFRF